MIGLILVFFAGLLSFSYITVFHLPKIKRQNPCYGVKNAREKLEIVAKWFLRVIGLKLEVFYEDEEAFKSMDKDRGIVFVSNHSSNFDIPILIESIPIDVGFVAKKEMETWPFFGTWMKYSGCAFLNRKNPREGIKDIKKAVSIVKEGHPLFIFPQGTRKSGFGNNEFKKGSFKLVTEANGYVVPVTMKGSDTIQKPGAKRIIMGRRVIVHIGTPIKVYELNEEDLKNLNQIIEGKIKNIYDNLAI